MVPLSDTFYLSCLTLNTQNSSTLTNADMAEIENKILIFSGVLCTNNEDLRS